MKITLNMCRCWCRICMEYCASKKSNKNRIFVEGHVYIVLLLSLSLNGIDKNGLYHFCSHIRITFVYLFCIIAHYRFIVHSFHSQIGWNTHLFFCWFGSANCGIVIFDFIYLCHSYAFMWVRTYGVVSVYQIMKNHNKKNEMATIWLVSESSK